MRTDERIFSMDVLAVIIFGIPIIFGLFGWAGYRFGQKKYRASLFCVTLALYVTRLYVTRLSTRSLTLSLNDPDNQWAFLAGAAGGDLPFIAANGALALAMAVMAVKTEEFKRLSAWLAGKIKEIKSNAKHNS